MNYYALFYNLSSTSGGFFAPRPLPGLHPWIPLEDFRPQTLNLLTPGKNPARTHASGRFWWLTVQYGLWTLCVDVRRCSV